MKKIMSVVLTVFIAAVSLALPAYAAKLSAPTGLSVSIRTPTSVRLEWSKVEGARKYTVYYSSDNKKYTGYSTTMATYATVRKLTSGTKYYFRVKSVDADGNKSAYSKAVTAVPSEESAVVKTSSSTISITDSPGTVTNNDYAVLRIKGEPGTDYTLKVYYSSAKSRAEGTGTKTADKNGVVSWKWKIGAKTKAGTHKIIIEGGGEKLETTFNTVTA